MQECMSLWREGELGKGPWVGALCFKGSHLRENLHAVYWRESGDCNHFDAFEGMIYPC